MYIHRTIEANIKSHFFKDKAIIIYGARQVGKSTLVKQILTDHQNLSTRYFNCDEAQTRQLFLDAGNSSQLSSLIGNSQLIIIDEAQRVTDIGLKLKLLVDNYPHQQIIATGSSSFDLSNQIAEPLTGRAWEFWLHPLSTPEILSTTDRLGFYRQLDSLLVYGSYPTVFLSPSLQEKSENINLISHNYLYKDLLKFNNLKASSAVTKLLEALALQIGQEVSYTELAQLVGIDKTTVRVYLDILEQAFIIFRLRPFSRNLRKEIGKLHKIYFYDTGVRNSLINNFNSLALRNDVGPLWENFVVSEKKKQTNFIGNLTSLYFWRTYDGQEIDLIEDKNGQLSAFEIKWQKPKKHAPIAWSNSYPTAIWEPITKDNFLDSKI